MKYVVAVIAVLLVCVTVLEPCVARRQPGLVVDEADNGVVLASSESSAGSIELEYSHGRSLLKTKSTTKSSKSKSKSSKSKSKSSKSKSKIKSKKLKGTNWSKGQAKIWGTVIGVACLVSIVGLCIIFCVMTEKKKKEDPNWNLLKRRVKPGVKRTITRTFTRKKAVHDDDDELKKPDADPPKLPS